MAFYIHIKSEINGVYGHLCTVKLYWANEMNFGMNNAPGAGSIAGPVKLLTSTVRPLKYTSKDKGTMTNCNIVTFVLGHYTFNSTRIHNEKDL